MDINYKETDIGLLPIDWDVVQLSDVTFLTMGQSPPSSTYNEIGNGMPFLQGKAEFGETYPTPIKWCSKPQKVAECGSVLISVRAPVGDVNLAKDTYCIGRGLAGINGTDLLDNWYLFFQLIYVKRRLEERGTGSTFKSINKGTLQNFLIALPPLPEQRAIAHVLNTVRQSIEAAEQIITAAQELKRSMMKYLFTYGPVPVDQGDQVQLKETEIGKIPEKWEVVKVGDFFSIQGGYSFKSKDYITYGLPLFRISNVSFGSADWESLVFLPQEYKEEYSDYLLEVGDIVMAITRPVVLGGIKVAKLTEKDVPSLLNQRVCRLKPKREIEIDYFYQYMFSNKFISEVSDGAIGSHQPNISTRKLTELLFPFAPIKDQKIISNILITLDEKISVENYRKHALINMFNSLLHHLMTGSIRVPLS